MIHEDSQNETAEIEVLSADDQKISRMLGNLRAVDAPKNFDFRLKARIANSSIKDYGPKSLFPILRYAAPLSLMLLIGAMFVFNNSVGVGDNLSVAESSEPGVSAGSTGEAQSAANALGNSAEIVGQIPVVDNSGIKKRQYVSDVNAIPARRAGYSGFPRGGSRDQPMRSPQGGFRDSALKKSIPTIYPRGLNPNMPVYPEKPPEFGNTGKFTVREVFSAIGIEADFGEDAWTVTSLKKGSLAERAGILKGDLIEAIDERQIGASTVFTGNVGAKTVTVRRLGRVFQLSL